MPHIKPIEETIQLIHDSHRDSLTQHIFVKDIANKALIKQRLDALKNKYQAEIKEMMHEPTFFEKIKQTVGASAGAYLVFNQVSQQAASGFSLNPITAISGALSHIFTGILEGPRALLAIAMAAETFDIIYQSLESQGQGADYKASLIRLLNENNAFSKIIKASFTGMSDDMLNAFCVREIRLKEKREGLAAINEEYLDQLLYILNTHLQSIYAIHDEDIENDANRSSFVRWYANIFETDEQRQISTRELQISLIEFMANFHNQLADEKSWVGEHPIRFSLYAGVAGSALGFLAISFIPALVVLAWPVLAATVGLGLIAGLVAYTYAQKAPYKRSEEERNQQQSFKHTFDEKKAELETLLTPINTLEKKDVQALNAYSYLTKDGYFTTSHIARGTQASWIRAYASYYAHSKMVVNDFLPKIKDLSKRAEAQTEALGNILKNLSQTDTQSLPHELKAYIGKTRTYIAHAPNDIQSRFMIIEKIKEQILEAVARHGISNNINANLGHFFETLFGNMDELYLAQNFCAANHETSYSLIVDKANQLANEIDTLQSNEPPHPIFVGATDYWQVLGINKEQLTIPTDDNIDSLLNNTKNFLRQLTPPADASNFASAHFSEAYYLYRTLLMRQFATLLVGKEVTEHVSERIQNFIIHTLNPTTLINQEVVKSVLSDIYYQDLFKPDISQSSTCLETHTHVYTENVAYFAQAMRADLAHHPVMAPAKHLNRVLERYLNTYPEALIFGDMRQATLNRLNFESFSFDNKTLIKFIDDSKIYLSKLKAASMDDAAWNDAPIDLSVLYQKNITCQALTLIKSILQASLRQKLPEDDVKLAKLLKNYQTLFEFINDNDVCLAFNDSEQDIKTYLQTLNGYATSSPEYFLHFAAMHSQKLTQKTFDADDIYKTEHAVTNLQHNIVIPQVRETMTREGAINISQDVPVVLRELKTVANQTFVAPNNSPSMINDLYHYFAHLYQWRTQIVSPEQLELQMIQAYLNSTQNTFWSPNHIALGTPGSWEHTHQTLLRQYPSLNGIDTLNLLTADAADVSNEDVLRRELINIIREIQTKSQTQCETLIAAIKNHQSHQGAPQEIEQYIAATRRFLDKPDDTHAVEKYKLREKAKEQILALTAQFSFEALAPQLVDFYCQILQGSEDELMMAHYLNKSNLNESNLNKSTPDSSQPHKLLEKAQQLKACMPDNILQGDQALWASLKIQVNPPMLDNDHIDTLLTDTKAFIRQITPAVPWSDSEHCHYSEAFYLYRTLLLKQLTHALSNSSLSKMAHEKIKCFIEETLHAKVDNLLFNHSRINDLNISDAMCLNFAFHPTKTPDTLLSEMLQSYLGKHLDVKPILLGNPKEITLKCGNDLKLWLSNIEKSIKDTEQLLDKLKDTPQVDEAWNKAPVNLYYAYKHTVTEDCIVLFKNLIIELGKKSPSQDKQNFKSLQKMYVQLYQFFDDACFDFDDNGKETIITIKLFQQILMNDKAYTLDEIIDKANTYKDKINLDSIYKHNYSIKLPKNIDTDPLTKVRENYIISRNETEDLTRSIVGISSDSDDNSNHSSSRPSEGGLFSQSSTPTTRDDSTQTHRP